MWGKTANPVGPTANIILIYFWRRSPSYWESVFPTAGGPLKNDRDPNRGGQAVFKNDNIRLASAKKTRGGINAQRQK